MAKLTYNTAAEYVNNSEQAKHLSMPVREQLIAITVKRKGVFTIRKTAPKAPAPKAVFLALKTARHLANWGDLNSWNESQTRALMAMSPDDRALFETALDQFNAAFKAHFGAQYGRKWGA